MTFVFTAEREVMSIRKQMKISVDQHSVTQRWSL